MAKHLLVVVTTPAEGQEEEFNRWYTSEHLDDVLRVPGFVAAQRFKLTRDTAKRSPGPYLAIYEMDTDDPDAAVAALTEASVSGRMKISTAMDAVNVVASIYTPITERKVGAPSND